jgi:hypothetical protein
MCFSATGSFGAAALLTGVGVVSLRQEQDPSHRMLAFVPLLYAGQQVAEGVVWSTLGQPEHDFAQLVAVTAFLAFALAIWPLWVPLSLRLCERDPRRRAVLSALSVVGVVVAVFAGAMLAAERPVAYVSGHSLSYGHHQTNRALVLGVYLPAYMIASVVPFFVSTVNRAKLMGAVLVLSLAVTFAFKRGAFVSVWCFFAALLSGIIVRGIGEHHRAIGAGSAPRIADATQG